MQDDKKGKKEEKGGIKMQRQKQDGKKEERSYILLPKSWKKGWKDLQ